MAAGTAVQMFLLALGCTQGQLGWEWIRGNQSEEMDVLPC